MSERIVKIVIAMAALSSDNPSHFLKDGVTPQIEALEELTGFEDITAAERDEALNQVNDNPTPPISSGKEMITLIGKTMVRVEEGEEQKAWGSTFIATKVIVENPETREDEEKMVLLGEFEKGNHEHESLMIGRRAIVFRGSIV